MIENIHIEDVIGYYSQLTRASVSGRTLKCHCPFHYDEFKSMKISVHQNTYECDLCGEKGDVVDFVQAIEGCKKKAAIKILTNFYETGIIFRDGGQPNIGAGEADLLSLPENFPEQSTYKMIVDSLGSYELADKFVARAFSTFGVGVVPEVFPEQFANLKGKLLFPIYNSDAKVSGFISTTASAKKKYKCWPENLLASSFYGFHQAIGTIIRTGFAYLVKDCEDVIIMHAAGFTNTIGYIDNSLLFAKVYALKGITKQVVLFRNEDIPGQVQCTKNTARLSYENISSSHIYLPENTNLSGLYHKLGERQFIYYIHQSTRLSRLEKLKKRLEYRLDEVLFDMDKASSVDDRIKLRSKVLTLQNKLNKILSILGNYSVNELL